MSAINELFGLYAVEFATISAIHFLAVASPGPDLAITLRQSVTHGRRCGIFTSIGIALGILFHASYCILGLGWIISRSVLAFTVIKYCGAAYLIYIGLKAIRCKAEDSLFSGEAVESKQQSAMASIRLGLLTNILNPKATLFFLSVFSVSVSQTTPHVVQLTYGVWMSFMTFLWFAFLSTVFSHTRVRVIFAKLGAWFERTMGYILLGLGAKLALSDL
jgi:RhtB (resistance to homoserine/threonine) family protein